MDEADRMERFKSAWNGWNSPAHLNEKNRLVIFHAGFVAADAQHKKEMDEAVEIIERQGALIGGWEHVETQEDVRDWEQIRLEVIEETNAFLAAHQKESD